jgi:hypothetical protein
MDWGKMITQFGFPIALAAYLIYHNTQVQTRRDTEMIAAIQGQQTATEELRKTVGFLAIVVARLSGQDLEETQKLAGVKFKEGW